MTDPHAVATMLSVFGTRDVDRLVASVEDSIEDIRAIAPGIGALVYLMPQWDVILSAPLPITLHLKSLRRCLKIACADGESAAAFAHWTS